MLILASSSPQRQKLLEGLGVEFRIVPPDVDESAHLEMRPLERASLLAYEKASAVAVQYPHDVVLGCDTLVVSADGVLCEKPQNTEDARSMLQRFSGTTILVHSAVSVLTAEGIHREGVSTSHVTFMPLSEQDIDWWISTGLWNGRSGGFQIDGPGQVLISHLDGDWTGVVGLPVFTLAQIFRELHLPLYPLP